MMKFYKYLICIAILLTSYSLLADVLYVSIEDLAKFAFDIVEGKVLKIEQKWDLDHKFIYTYTTINVENALKKKITTKEITLKEIGGQLDGYTTDAPCQPEYKTNEKVFIFLQKDENYYYTDGLNQGKFNIYSINGEKSLTRKVNVNELTILNNIIRRDDIKHIFRYEEIILIINKVNHQNVKGIQK